MNEKNITKSFRVALQEYNISKWQKPDDTWEHSSAEESAMFCTCKNSKYWYKDVDIHTNLDNIRKEALIRSRKSENR